jgi:DNA-binding IclR family transcriptional regulator
MWGSALIGLARQVQPCCGRQHLPALRRLADATTSTAHLSITDGADGLVVVAVAEPPRAPSVFVGVRVGSRSGLEDSAAGQAVLLSRRGDSRPVVSTTAWARRSAASAAAARVRARGSRRSSGCTSCRPPDESVLGRVARGPGRDRFTRLR